MLDRRCKEYRDHLLNCFKCGKKGAPPSETSKDVLISLRALVYFCQNCLPSQDGICVLCYGLGSDFVCQSCLDYNRKAPSVFHHTCLFQDPEYHPGDNVCPDCREGVTEKEVREQEDMGKEPEKMEEDVQKDFIQVTGNIQVSDKSNNCTDNLSDKNHDSFTEESEAQGVSSPVAVENKAASNDGGDSSASDSHQRRGSTSPQESPSSVAAVNTVVNLLSKEVPFRRRKPETWSVEEVESFFSSSGFRTEGSVFREQEIDGKSLLLLKREDVLKGLPGIKVGPALKIFSFINHLQNFFVVTPERD
jgi:hypothetical protein